MATDTSGNVPLTVATYERLRADVLSCRLKPNQKLIISDLADELAVSPGAIREALSRLTAEGLVVSEAQRGFRAAPISEKELRDLTEARIHIETLCLQSAIQNGDVGWEARIVAAHHELSRIPLRVPGDPQVINEEWAQAHAKFHLAIISSCDNDWLVKLHNLLYAQSERYRRLSKPLFGEKRNVNKEHQALMQAVIARDIKKATRVMSDHLKVTTRTLLEAKTLNEPRTSYAIG
jgi:DNA-binding GntR family transcriptional regulator